MNEDVVNNVPQFFCQKPIANNQKNRNQFKLTYLRDFALFTDIILLPSANYFQLTVYSEHIDVYCISKWFESGLNVHKLMLP